MSLLKGCDGPVGILEVFVVLGLNVWVLYICYEDPDLNSPEQTSTAQTQAA